MRRKAITVIPSVGVAQSSLGPREIVYWKVLGTPGYFRWAAEDTSTDDDGATVIELSGGMPGRLLRVREPDRGANLGNGNATIYVSGKRWRVMPPNTLTQDSALTLATAGAEDGDVLFITRNCTNDYLYTIANGGPAAGNVAVTQRGYRAWCLAYFDGTNWIHRASAQALSS